jgi:EAL domain-containing protein (putative c-di-GMP-specific phosphodiesterase class I)
LEGEIIAYESVVKIHHNGHYYGSETFRSIALDMGQMGMITRAMIRHTFEFSTHLDPTKPIIITLTAYDLNDESLLAYIHFWIERYHIKPSQIFFQIIEDVKSLQNQFILEFVRQLQYEGFKIILDDFGIGECNLSILLSLKPDYVKLHPEMIAKGFLDTQYSPIITKMVEIIHIIGAKAIAPSITKADQIDWLIASGIDYGDGPFIGTPFEVHHD